MNSSAMVILDRCFVSIFLGMVFPKYPQRLGRCGPIHSLRFILGKLFRTRSPTAFHGDFFEPPAPGVVSGAPVFSPSESALRLGRDIFNGCFLRKHFGGTLVALW